MNKKLIKTLAQQTIQGTTVNSRLAEFVLSNLSKADLKTYLFYLRKAIKQHTVYITSPNALGESDQKTLSEKFPGKMVQFSSDAALGAGLKIQNGDNVLDTSIHGVLKNVFNQLKSNI